MGIIATLATLTAFTSFLALTTAQTAGAASTPPRYLGPDAIYFLRVDPAGSSIVAVKVNSDGTLSNSTSETSTGGAGAQSVNVTAPEIAPTSIDPLQGQDAVVVAGQYLFTVNSGSNTMVVFHIAPESPLELEMIGRPAPTLGQFAMSVAYSKKYRKACVLNGGEVNGVSCFDVDPSDGLIPDGVGLRRLGFNSTTPVQFGGKQGSGSDIRFTPDSKKLVITFKGDVAPPTLGHVVVFDVSSSGQVSAAFTDSRVKPLSAIFGFAFDESSPSRLLITDANFGGALASLDYITDKVTGDATINSTAFAASCWATYSGVTHSLYNVNAAAPVIGKISPANGNLQGLIRFPEELGGGTDIALFGRRAYFLTAVNAIGVLDVIDGRLAQTFHYANIEDRPFWTGMATYSSMPCEAQESVNMRL